MRNKRKDTMTPTVLTVNPGFGVLKKQADALLFSLTGR